MPSDPSTVPPGDTRPGGDRVRGVRPRVLRPLVLGPALLAAAAPTWAATTNIMLVGYWPPTNNMIRQFSTNPVQNPGGWRGQNWQGLGYNIYSYFPEFPGGVGVNPKGEGDFEVDYQDTSADFWRITAEVRPVALVTFSRGSPGSNWELEAGARNLTRWIPDYQAPTVPDTRPPDGSWPSNAPRFSNLPMASIRDGVNGAGLGINAFIDNSNNVGGFLSEYLAYHGLWYRSLHADPASPTYCALSGHIHVGIDTPLDAATIATEITLRTTIAAIPSPGALAMFGVWGIGRRRTR